MSKTGTFRVWHKGCGNVVFVAFERKGEKGGRKSTGKALARAIRRGDTIEWTAGDEAVAIGPICRCFWPKPVESQP